LVPQAAESVLQKLPVLELALLQAREQQQVPRLQQEALPRLARAHLAPQR
jgi:hypothetical protein